MSLLLFWGAEDAEPPAPPEPETEVTGRLFLAWGNLADQANLSGGGWRDAMPLANLKRRNLERAARSETVAADDTWFDVDLGVEQVFRVVALDGHNFGLDALWRVRIGNDPTFAGAEFDSGWTAVWPAVFETEALEWEDENFWSWTYTEAQRQGLKWMVYVRPPKMVAARYIRIEIEDPNNLASYVQVGRLFIANGWSPSRGMAFDASLAINDVSDVQAAWAGAEIYAEKPRFRTVEFVLKALPEDETYGRAFELMRQAGRTGEVLLLWKDDDTVHALRRQFIGRLEELSAIEHPYPDRQMVAFRHKETL